MMYTHIFSVFTAHLESVLVSGGYPLLFITVFFEGLPLVGTAVPGHVAIIAAGFFSRIGYMNLTYVLFISSLGAILGDYMAFLLGKNFGMSLIDKMRPYFFIRESHILKVRSLLAKHTGKALILGRFSPVTRSLMPFFVGASKTGHARFWVFNIIGGICWAVVSVMFGYAFGIGYHAVSGYIGKLAVVAILMTIVIVWGYKFVNIRFHIFRKYELFTLALNIISLISLGSIIEQVTDSNFRLSFDIWVHTAVESLNRTSAAYGDIAYVVSSLGSVVMFSIIGAVIGAYYLMKKKWRSSAIMISSIAFTGIAVGSMKEIFLTARPSDPILVVLNDPSFPSGHSAFAAAFFVALIYLVAPKFHSWIKREISIVLAVVVVALVGISRLVLSVHWASDVIAGWSLGIFVATSCILLVKYISTILMKKKMDLNDMFS